MKAPGSAAAALPTLTRGPMSAAAPAASWEIPTTRTEIPEAIPANMVPIPSRGSALSVRSKEVKFRVPRPIAPMKLPMEEAADLVDPWRLRFDRFKRSCASLCRWIVRVTSISRRLTRFNTKAYWAESLPDLASTCPKRSRAAPRETSARSLATAASRTLVSARASCSALISWRLLPASAR